MTRHKIGLVGGRGFVGAELIRLLGEQPNMQLAFASSASKAGTKIPDSSQQFIALRPEQITNHAELDALVLALPNDQAASWVAAVDQAGLDLAIIDISADYRFDPKWVYGLPEINHRQLIGARRIANPGCYATAAQLALYPLRDMLAGTPSIFGVSGYSGAGATPNPNNDLARLHDNLLPYSLSGHIHQHEISHHLGQNVHFSPHVAAFFRGISLTIHLQLRSPATAEQILEKLRQFYQNACLIELCNQIPNLQQVVGTANTRIGGVTLDPSGQHCVLVVTLDNLLKGAASQVMQNLQLALS